MSYQRLRKRRPLFGVGINDADYNVQVYSDSKPKKKVWVCPFYARWANMLTRCYYENYQKKQVSYKGKSVSDSWLYFSDFRLWMESQKWEGLDLDKDILKKGNTEYSASTCAFLPKALNNLLKDSKQYSENLPLGVLDCTVYRKSKRRPFKMQCQIFGQKKKLSSWHSTPEEAHKAWQWEKANQIERAVSWYANQEYFRTDVAEALTQRVWSLRLDYSKGVQTYEL